MNPLSTSVAAAAPPARAALADLYPRYREFVSSAFPNEPALMLEFDDFVLWWSALPVALREHNERTYRLGYQATVAAGADAIRQVCLARG